MSGALAEPPETAGVRWIQRLIAFQLVCLGWVFFRADSVATALSLLGRLLTGWSTPTELVQPTVLLALLAGLGTQFLPPEPGELLKARLSALPPVALGTVLAGALFVITSMGPQGVAPFIYFQF
jgi:hypothetical protein